MQLRRFEKQFGIEDMRKSAGNRLTQLIEQAESMTGRKVVIIIDEYDAPLLDVLHDETKLEAVRTFMLEFYAPICDQFAYSFCLYHGNHKILSTQHLQHHQ